MSRKPVIAVVGATGTVGEAMLDILNERLGRDCEIHPVASENSLGKQVTYGNRSLDVEVLDDFDFSNTDYALFSAGASVSREHAPRACEAGAVVIDNTSEYRYDDDKPLVIPEVNGAVLDNLGPGALIANPNCSTIQMVVAIAPIHAAVGISRINVATYQSVSGAGRAGLEELARQTAARLSLQEVKPKAFDQVIAFNVLPQIDSMQENGYTREEMKMQWETSKILDDPEIGVNATAVRVPVFYGHAEAVHLETRQALSVDEASKLLAEAEGVTLIANDGETGHPTPAGDAAGKDDVFVGRLRKDHTHELGLNLWVVADNVRKGAALNAVQILQYMENQRGSSS